MDNTKKPDINEMKAIAFDLADEATQHYNRYQQLQAQVEQYRVAIRQLEADERKKAEEAIEKEKALDTVMKDIDPMAKTVAKTLPNGTK